MSRINALERLAAMSEEEITEALKAALEESGIEYTEGKEDGGIIFSGLSPRSRCDGCLHEFDWGYQECSDCARMYQDKYTERRN